MQGLVNAIDRYHSTYQGYPVSTAVKNAAANNGNSDFTYGGSSLSTNASMGAGIWSTNNSEVIAILMDLETTPSGVLTVNNQHVKNAQQIKFLQARMTDDIGKGGVGPDLIYRDPWGNPYIISMDLNYDEKCRDEFYRLDSVSQDTAGGNAGINGLIKAGVADTFELNGDVMVWSLGPDKAASTAPTPPANRPPLGSARFGLNKDNILSWKSGL
jgi:hypothetical protein